MNKIQFTIQNNQNYEINFIKEDVREAFSNFIKQRFERPFLIVDKTIPHLYPDLLKDIKAPTLLLKGGEHLKTFSTVEKITRFLQENYCHRHDSMLVIGGGCLGDVAGFTASIYKRGMEWFFFPTTLLSQVDSSVGGKVAINNKYGKNQLGAFWPSRQVYIFPDFLKSLDVRQYNAGMAEIIKVALFAKTNLSILLQEVFPMEITTLIESAVQAKLDIIGNDWHESRDGTRIALNFGHTIGHGLEKTVPDLLHGEAVALGMVAELHVAQAVDGIFFDSGVVQKQLCRFGLPVEFKQVLSKIQPSRFMKALIQDKKNIDNNIAFIVPGVDRSVKKFILSLEQLKRILF